MKPFSSLILKKSIKKSFSVLNLSSSVPKSVQDMSVKNFNAIIKGDSRALYQIVDVREPSELLSMSIKGDDIINLPLSKAAEWSPKVAKGEILDPSKPTLCLCLAGIRSMKMASFLVQQAGYTDVFNVVGGMSAYADIDSSVIH